MTVPVLVNGNKQDGVSTLDRGLLYGDGIFETIAVRNGTPRYWKRHMARLDAGCERLGLSCCDHDRLADEAGRMTGADAQAVIKIIITRGTGGRGYREPVPQQPTRIVQRHPFPDAPEGIPLQGVKTVLCRTRLGSNPVLAGIKHLNRLEQVQARREWEDPEIAEGLMMDAEDHIVEGTMSNLFLLDGGTLVTPSLKNCGVAGIMRSVITDLVQAEGLEVARRPVGRDDLLAAGEVFLCNSVFGVLPVTAVDGHAFRVGELTQHVAHLLDGHNDDSRNWLSD